MTHTIVLLVSELTAVAHLMMSLVLFYFSRRRIGYLAQAWIMLLIGLMYCGIVYFVGFRAAPHIGILHPGMLLYLLVCSYLQSLCPLGLSMPGYLQWGRMWTYAVPAIVLLTLYGLGQLLGSDFAKVYEAEDIREYFLSGDILLRLTALLLSCYYILNIFVLPHRLVRRLELPPYVQLYGVLLGITALLFVGLTIRFSRVGFIGYMLVFTGVNIFLSFRILRPILDSVSYPDIRPVAERPTNEELLISAGYDFNEANKQRFEVLEYVMQNERPYTNSAFTRDWLCRLAGFNRHFVLQCLRSQGYNDVHEYISRYRTAYLKKLIENGTLKDVRQVEAAGFKTYKTATLAFEKYEGYPLADFFEATRKQPDQSGEEENAAE